MHLYGTRGVLEALARTGDQDIRRIAILMGIINVLIPIGLLIYASITGIRFWWAFWGEDNLITWFSSVQLVLIGLVAYLNYSAASLWRYLGGEGNRGYWIWLVFTAGFFFLALDERFEIHEALREGIIQEYGEVSILSFARPGDIGMYLYLAVGLVLMVFLVSELRVARSGLLLFVIAVAIAAPIVVIDSMPKDITRQWPLEIQRFLTSVFEEGGENWAQFFFLLSFLSVLRERLSWIGALPDGQDHAGHR